MVQVTSNGDAIATSRPNKKGWRRFFKGIKRAADLLVLLFWFCVGAAISLIITAELYDRGITVEEISVPAELAERGYTPAVVGFLILNEWSHIDRTATTSRRRHDIGLTHSELYRTEEVEVALPGVDSSLSSIVDYFRGVLGIPAERVGGAILLMESPAPECAQGCYAFLLRISGNEPSQVRLPSHPKTEVEEMIRQAARGAVERLDPYLLANFYYASREAEPEQAVEIPRLIQLALSNGDNADDPWAHTLAGAMLNRQGRWEEAIPHFNRALALNGEHSSALNSRCWARAHLRNEVQSAIDDCRTALALNPASYQTMDSLAYALDQNGQSEAALTVIRCARRLAPRSEDVAATYNSLREKLPNASDRPVTSDECEAIF